MKNNSFPGAQRKNKGVILVLLQILGEGLHPLCLSAIGTALRLGAESGAPVQGLVIASRLPQTARAQLENSGLDKVHVCIDESYDGFCAEAHCDALVACAQKLAPDIILASATPEGRALAAMAAAHLHTGVTADCTALGFTEEGLLLQTRPAFGGHMMASIVCPTARPQMATLRFGAAYAAKAGKTTQLEMQPPPPRRFAATARVQWVERTAAQQNNEAECIVALGGGLAAKNDINLFEEVAEKLGAQLMCTRALVERGWLPRSCQIGLSGRSVSPKLLICFGVSGSVQFQAGIQSTKQIIAVNTDKNAPILKLAGLPILGDMYGTAKALLL